VPESVDEQHRRCSADEERPRWQRNWVEAVGPPSVTADLRRRHCEGAEAAWGGASKLWHLSTAGWGRLDEGRRAHRRRNHRDGVPCRDPLRTGTAEPETRSSMRRTRFGDETLAAPKAVAPVR
jgi:hypothetical protein